MNDDPVAGTHNRLDHSQVTNAVQAQVIHNLYLNASDGLALKPHQVPRATRSYVNQVRTLAAATRTLARAEGDLTAHFVVFSGTPGVGKREISRYWVHQHLDHFPDGQFHADLGGGPDGPELVSEKLREFLLAVGFNPAGIPQSLAGRAACFRSWSTGRQVVVALDNAWSAGQVRWFTPGPGRSSVVVSATTRLAGLGADEIVTRVEVPLLDDDAARALLVELIGEDRVAGEPDATRSLLGACGGLAIALRVVALTLEASASMRLSRLVADLDDERRRPRVLAQEQDQSVYAVFSNAYDRVSRTAQYCYRILGRHPGIGDAGIAALAAGLDVDQDDAYDAVEELLGVGLATQPSDEEAGRRDRFRIHELIRWHAQYLAARAPLGSDPDSQDAVERMLTFYHERAAMAGHAMMPGRGWSEMLFPDFAFDGRPAVQVLGVEPGAWLELERDNLRACVETAYRRGQFGRVCHLAVMLWPLHEQGKHLGDQIVVNDWGLEAAAQLGDSSLLALISIQRGFPPLHLGEPALAGEFFARALQGAQASGQPALEATAVESLGLARLAQGQVADAHRLLRRNLELALELALARRIALARMHLAKAEVPEVAVELLAEAAAGLLGLVPRDVYNEAKVQLWLGRKLTELSRFDEASPALQRALTVMTALRRPFDCLQIADSLGDLAAASGDAVQSRRWYQEALTIADQGGFTIESARLHGKVDGPAESLDRGLERADDGSTPD